MLKAIFLIITLALLGCSEAPATTGTGGTGGTTTASTTGGSGGGATTSSTSTGAPPCVEPTPMGYPDPLAGWAGAVDTFGGLGTAPDEAAKGKGSAAAAVKFGPFQCPHDFDAIAIDYYEDGPHELPDVARVAVITEAAKLPSSPPFPPVPTVIPRGECATSGAGPDACPPLQVIDNVPFVVVPISFHVAAGDVIWPSVEMANGSMGLAVSKKAAPDLTRAAYYAPPGSAAGGPSGSWALLAEPPPGIGVYKFAPVMRLIEAPAP